MHSLACKPFLYTRPFQDSQHGCFKACRSCICGYSASRLETCLSFVHLFYVGVQARVAKYIACEEEWLRLLVQELTPVMEHLQDQELPLSKPFSTSHTNTVQYSAAANILLLSSHLRQSRSLPPFSNNGNSPGICGLLSAWDRVSANAIVLL